MRVLNVLQLAFAVLMLPAPGAFAQSDTVWDKSYPVSAAPTLTLEVGDSALRVHPCTGCHAVRVHIKAEGAKLSQYTLEEGQNGNQVHLSLKQKPHVGFQLNWHSSRQVTVDVETPPEVALEARASDGSLEVRGLHGAISLRTSDGAQTVRDVSGQIALQASDGSITVERSSGTLEARISDGNLEISGTFSALQLHSSDGPMHVALAEGSRLTAPSSIQASDGSVTVQFPHSFPAELDLHSSDGHIGSALPLVVEGFQSKGGHGIHGKLDGGGAPLQIHTSDGSIRLSRS